MSNFLNTKFAHNRAMQEQAAQVRQAAAEMAAYTEATQADIPTGYAYAEIRPALPEWNAVIVDFQYLRPMNIITRRATLGTPRAAQLLQLAQGGAA